MIRSWLKRASASEQEGCEGSSTVSGNKSTTDGRLYLIEPTVFGVGKEHGLALRDLFQ